MQLQLSFDLRRPDFASSERGELYAAMLEICEWADSRGFERAFFGEHHGAEDGYLPSPLSACAAAAGRTRHLRFRPVLLTPLYDPLRLAEDIAVVDLLSGGRIEPLLAAGYRPAEFAMFDRALDDRRRRVDETLAVLRQAWTGEPFEYHGRTVQVTPTPLQKPGPPIYLGGSFPSIARQAAHVADWLLPRGTKAVGRLPKRMPRSRPRSGTVTGERCDVLARERP